MKTINKGDKGEEVKKLQTLLKITVDGVFGPKTEEAVKAYQKAHNLDADGIVGDKTWASLLNVESIQIREGYINVHISPSAGRPIKYIVVHYTAGGTSKPGTAMATRNVFLKRNASADFVVDDRDIVQINPHLKNYYCWSVGDKKNPYTGGGQLHGQATNKNTISIEICSNLKSGYSAAVANHQGWYFTDASLNNAIKLVKYLMKMYNIPKSNVVRHYDITGKMCPGIVGWNKAPIYDNKGNKTGDTNNETEWEKFKSKF